MSDPTRPFLVIYVVWHPDFTEGADIADALREHFRRKLYENVAGGTGLSVIYRFAVGPGSTAPLPIDLAEAEATAVVVLADQHLAQNSAWAEYVNNLTECTEAAGLGCRVFPIAFHTSALSALGVNEQALRWDKWVGSFDERCRQLTSELAYEFCRMLRHYLAHLKHPTEDEAALESYLKKVSVFLSHSKHDAHGEKIAKAIRDHLHDGHGLASFFDVHDIPAGLRFDKVLLHKVRASAMVAIHTDSYSSREWCRREVIEAKRWNAPLVVANCINDLDERGFPYMSNVPMVRLDPHGVDRIDFVIGRLLDEVLKDFLWRCRIELVSGTIDSTVIFVPRPPELITLANLPPETDVAKPVIVYPDPPLSAEESRLFAEVAPRVQLRSFTEWLAGAMR